MTLVRNAALALAAIVLLGFLAIVTGARYGIFNDGHDGPTLEAKVVRFGTIASRWQADKVIVVASTAAGRTGQGVLARDRLEELNCQIGSPVSAHMEGAVMVVDALTCGSGQKAKPAPA